MPSSQSTLVENQLRLARTALEEGLRSSADVRAESLLARFPVVANDTEAALELVYTEFAVREELGQKPDPSEWYTRFPQWHNDLEQMFEVHRELKKEEVKRQSRSQTGSSPPPKPAPTSTAGMIGEFEVLGEVGRGGMGVVYKARQASLGRVVAVKVLLAGAHAGGRERERFRREAETAARLDHPNIVRIFAVGEHDGRAYCAMEYVDGASLADLFDGSPWPVLKAAELVATVAIAAQHAHENGVVHRDLKPANILVTGSRKPGLAHPTQPDHPPTPKSSAGTMATIKIVDFGLAKSLLDTDTGPTRTGDIIGTPAYMAPEQAGLKTVPIGATTDVWGMGVTLYELLVGHTPFQGATTVETLEQARSAEPVSPRRLRPALPRDLEVICLKCLRKDPRHRYPTASALAEDLNRFLRGEPILARPASAVEHVTRWCRRNPVVAGLTTAAVILAVVAVVFGVAAVVNLDSARRSADQLADQQRAAAAEQAELRLQERRRSVKLQVNEGIRMMNDGDFAGGAVLLADAMAKDPDPENENLHRIRLGTALRATPTLRQLFHVPVTPDQFALEKGEDGRLGVTAAPDDLEPLLSQDLTTLISIRQGSPTVFWDPRTGTSRSVRLSGDDANARLVALSSNGRAVIGLQGELTRAWDTISGDSLRLPLAPEYGTVPPPFTPNGSCRLTDGDTATTVRMVTADGSPVGKMMVHAGDIRSSCLSADGTRVATGSTDHTARVWDAATGNPITEPLDMGVAVVKVALSSDRKLVTAVGADGMFQTWQVETSEPIGYRAQHQHGGAILLQYNPRKAELATAGWNHGLQVWDVKVGRTLNQPMTDTTPIVAFGYSPRGETTVVVDQSRSARVWEPESATPLSPKLFAGEREVAKFTADSRHLLTVSTGGEVRVWDTPSLRPTGSVVHGGQALRAEWRPDGRGVLSVGLDGVILSEAPGRVDRRFPHRTCHGMALRESNPPLLATRDSTGGIRLWDFATGKQAERQIRPPSPVRSMLFTPDGKLAAGGEDGVVRFWDPATGEAEGMALRHGSKVDHLSISRDGSRLLAGTIHQMGTLWELPSGKQKQTIPLVRSAPMPVFTPDGRQFAVVTGTTITLLSAADGSTRGPTIEVGLWSERPVFSADGQYLATWNTGAKSVIVWDAATGKQVGSPLVYPDPHGQSVRPDFAFSGDGRRLALAGRSFIVVWEVATGTQLTPPIPNRFTNDVSFSADSRALLVASGDNTVRTIDLSPDTRPVEVLAEHARLLANRTLGANGELVPLDHDQARRLWEKFRPVAKPKP